MLQPAGNDNDSTSSSGYSNRNLPSRYMCSSSFITSPSRTSSVLPVAVATMATTDYIEILTIVATSAVQLDHDSKGVYVQVNPTQD